VNIPLKKGGQGDAPLLVASPLIITDEYYQIAEEKKDFYRAEFFTFRSFISGFYVISIRDCDDLTRFRSLTFNNHIPHYYLHKFFPTCEKNGVDSPQK
jgi:hypothetical protein